MNLKLIFGLGVGLAVAGLACSLNSNGTVSLIGSLLTLLAIACTTWIAYSTRGVPSDPSFASQKRWNLAKWVSLVLVAGLLGAMFSLYPHASLSNYAAPILLFGLCMMLLLQLRTQGKIS